MAEPGFGLQTLLRPGIVDESVDAIDFVAVHGLNGTTTSTWAPDPDSATNLVSNMFGDRAAHVRFSVFSYNLSISPVDAFVSKDIQEWAIKLLEALISLRQADHRRHPIVFMGHDLGVTLAKEVIKRPCATLNAGSIRLLLPTHANFLHPGSQLIAILQP